MSWEFQKKKEDFVCQNCGQKVSGTGYTDHCPRCLWSRHVDEFPGDRKSVCHGMMRPMEVEVAAGEHIIHYRCEKCRAEKKCKSLPEDNFDEIMKLTGGLKKF